MVSYLYGWLSVWDCGVLGLATPSDHKTGRCGPAWPPWSSLSRHNHLVTTGTTSPLYYGHPVACTATLYWQPAGHTIPARPITCREGQHAGKLSTFGTSELKWKPIRSPSLSVCLSWYPGLHRDDFIVLLQHKERTEWNLCELETLREPACLVHCFIFYLLRFGFANFFIVRH